MTIPFAAAKQWPPWLKTTVLQDLMGSSLTVLRLQHRACQRWCCPPQRSILGTTILWSNPWMLSR